MVPTLYCLLGLAALIPFSVSVPANPAIKATNLIDALTPLPPSPQGHYNIPGTSLSIVGRAPFGPRIAPENAFDCTHAAQDSIAATIAASGDALLPHAGWRFADYNVQVSASRIFPHLGTYSQLSSAVGALVPLMGTTGSPGARQFNWFLSDDVLGLVMRGSIKPSATFGTGAANGTMTTGTVSMSSAAATHRPSIVAAENLDTS